MIDFPYLSKISVLDWLIANPDEYTLVTTQHLYGHAYETQYNFVLNSGYTQYFEGAQLSGDQSSSIYFTILVNTAGTKDNNYVVIAKRNETEYGSDYSTYIGGKYTDVLYAISMYLNEGSLDITDNKIIGYTSNIRINYRAITEPVIIGSKSYKASYLYIPWNRNTQQYTFPTLFSYTYNDSGLNIAGVNAVIDGIIVNSTDVYLGDNMKFDMQSFESLQNIANNHSICHSKYKLFENTTNTDYIDLFSDNSVLTVKVPDNDYNLAHMWDYSRFTVYEESISDSSDLVYKGQGEPIGLTSDEYRQKWQGGNPTSSTEVLALFNTESKREILNLIRNYPVSVSNATSSDYAYRAAEIQIISILYNTVPELFEILPLLDSSNITALTCKETDTRTGDTVWYRYFTGNWSDAFYSQEFFYSDYNYINLYNATLGSNVRVRIHHNALRILAALQVFKEYNGIITELV